MEVLELLPYMEFGRLRTGLGVVGWVVWEEDEELIEVSEFVDEPVLLLKTLSVVLDR